jgi:hypothetical protein
MSASAGAVGAVSVPGARDTSGSRHARHDTPRRPAAGTIDSGKPAYSEARRIRRASQRASPCHAARVLSGAPDNRLYPNLGAAVAQTRTPEPTHPDDRTPRLCVLCGRPTNCCAAFPGPLRAGERTCVTRCLRSRRLVLRRALTPVSRAGAERPTRSPSIRSRGTLTASSAAYGSRSPTS